MFMAIVALGVAWGMVSSAFADSSLYYREQLQIEKAWDLTVGDPNVRVALISTGVNYIIPELEKKIYKNPGETGNGRENDGIDNDGNGYIDDVYGADTFLGTGNPIHSPDFDFGTFVNDNE